MRQLHITTKAGRRLTARQRQRGQTLALVALVIGFGVLLGLVAVAADGGGALLQRRNMQNGADAAALGAVQMLGASVVLSGGVPVYAVSNADLTARIDQTVGGNRGGAPSEPTYSTTLEYGTFANPGYTFTVAAVNSNGTWEYTSPYTGTAMVPGSVDAVRVTAHIDNPTTFASVVGIQSISVEARAAAALNNAANYVAEGPTWPMTRCEIPEMDPEYGVCSPFLFWSSNINEEGCRTPGNFKSLLQLGAHQGASYEGAHEQLLTEFDARPAMTEVTGVNNPCGNSSWAGRWSPGGNCTDPLNNPPASYGTTCCSNNDSVADIDIANFIVNEFQGRISLDSTWPSNYFRPGYTPPPGDWIEVYNGGNLGNNIAFYIRQYIDTHGTTDGLAGYYGLHVDKIMYLFDIGEEWTNQYPGCGPNSGCPYQWQPQPSNQPPHRVHISQSLRFRFYQAMANTGGFDTPAAICGTSDHYNTTSSQVYGVFAGSIVTEPPCPDPPCSVGHGLNNYIGFIDP